MKVITFLHLSATLGSFASFWLSVYQHETNFFALACSFYALSFMLESLELN